MPFDTKPLQTSLWIVIRRGL